MSESRRMAIDVGSTAVKVGAAREVARRWVEQVAPDVPGFHGAFFHGSINEMSSEDPFPSTSDVDVGIVYDGSYPLSKLGKTRREGVLVEGAAISLDRLATAEQVLADYRLSPSFRTHSIIVDRTGHLTRLREEVSRHFADRVWVLARCADARKNCLKYVSGLDESTPYHVQAIFWLFAEGNLSHVLLAAALRNPTVRRRYSVVHEVLTRATRLDVHEALLGMLGCRDLSRSRVEHHLRHMTDAFDRAAEVRCSNFPFGSDISAAARSVAVGGSEQLIECGEYREAMFWIAVTYARCMAVLEKDGARGDSERFSPSFRSAMTELGVPDFDAMQRKMSEIEEFLPSLMALAEVLVSANPDIRG